MRVSTDRPVIDATRLGELMAEFLYATEDLIRPVSPEAADLIRQAMRQLMADLQDRQATQPALHLVPKE